MIQHYIVELEIIVNQSRRIAGIGIWGKAIGKPLDDQVDFGDLGRFGSEPSFGPTLYLPLHKTYRLAELIKPGGHYVDSVQGGKRIDNRFADAAPQSQVVSDFRRYLASHHETAPPLHQVEGGANYGRIIAQQVWPGSQREERIDGAEQPVFARHVVRRRSDRSKGRPPQHEFTLAATNQVRQVGMTTGKLLKLKSGFQIKRLTS